MWNLDRKDRAKFGNSKVWKRDAAKKKVCRPNGNSDFKEGENQSKESDSVDKKAMLSSTKMGKFHPTQSHFSAEYSLQPHCSQNTNPIFTVLSKTEFF